VGGTALTIKLAKKFRKPYLLIDLSQGQAPQKVLDWARDNQVRILNIAGPREGEAPGIHDRTKVFLREILRMVQKES
jgi:hypothetical protein